MMLRAYLSVIRDSFRAAMNSRVLYIVLALIVVVLLALAPLHVRQSLDWKLSLDNDLPAPGRLVTRLVEDGETGRRSAVAHIWNQLSPELQADLKEESTREDSDEVRSGPPPGRQVHSRLVNEFNALMESGDLYDEEAFKGKRLVEEADQLIAMSGSRSRAEDRRLNRLLLSSALRRDVDMPGETQLDFYYFNWHWSAFTTSASHATFASGITNWLPGFFDKFVMSIGIFIAILVTASIVPEMLEPGSLNLLLSKPIHRWGLLLAKYIGGCVFILLCASLFFIGIYFWMGIQLGIWERAILISIPVYVVVFAMYYSVSVFAGIWFRSPILCITFAILFWAVCFVIGYGYNLLDYRHYNTSPRQMVAVNDGVVMVDMLQRNLVWDDRNNRWTSPSTRDLSPEEQSFEFVSFFQRFDEFPATPGPVEDRNTHQVVLVDGSLMEVATNAQLKLVSANPDENWQIATRGDLPPGSVQFFHSPRFGQITISNSGGVFRWTGKEEEVPENDTAAENSTVNGIANLIKNGAAKSEYERISDETDIDVSGPSFASHNPGNEEIAVYSDTQLVVMSVSDNDQYSTRIKAPVGNHENNRMTAFVRYRGSHIFVMLGNGWFYHVLASDLSILHEQYIGDHAAVRSLSASPDGDYAAITLRSGELWIYDADRQTRLAGSGVPQTDILAATFDNQGQLWTGDRFRVARLFNLKTGERVTQLAPEAGMMTRAFRMVVRPLYRIFPKPGEFYKLVSHLSASANTQNNPDVDLTGLPHRDDPWLPLRSGVIFIAIVLSMACLMFQRQDY